MSPKDSAPSSDPQQVSPSPATNQNEADTSVPPDAPRAAPPPFAAGAAREGTRAEPPVESPFWALVSAALFLYVGFVMVPVGISGDAMYDYSVSVFVWMARVVGIGLVLVAVLAFARHALAAPVGFLVDALAAAGCLVPGAVWLIRGADVFAVLILLFGVINAGAARNAWAAWRAQARRRQAEVE